MPTNTQALLAFALVTGALTFACGKTARDCVADTPCQYESTNSVMVEPTADQRRCTEDDECVTIRSGDVCQGSACDNDSINREASDAYAGSFSTGRASCNEADVTLAIPAMCESRARCNHTTEQCEIVGRLAPQDCTTESGCYRVTETRFGDPCESRDQVTYRFESSRAGTTFGNEACPGAMAESDLQACRFTTACSDETTRTEVEVSVTVYGTSMTTRVERRDGTESCATRKDYERVDNSYCERGDGGAN